MFMYKFYDLSLRSDKCMIITMKGIFRRKVRVMAHSGAWVDIDRKGRAGRANLAPGSGTLAINVSPVENNEVFIDFTIVRL